MVVYFVLPFSFPSLTVILPGVIPGESVCVCVCVHVCVCVYACVCVVGSKQKCHLI